MSKPTKPDSAMSAIEPLLEAYRQGKQTVLLSGRTLFDLHIDENGSMRPLHYTLVRRVREEFGMASLVFNMALGPRWAWDGFDPKTRREHEAKLKAAEIFIEKGSAGSSFDDRPPFEQAFILLKSIRQAVERGQDLPPMLVLVEFAEDVVPFSEHGPANEWIAQLSELLVLIGNDYMNRKYPILLILAGIPERMDRRVVNSLRPVHLPQPDREEKLTFIKALKKMPGYLDVRFEKGLDDCAMANLTARIPNQGLEEAFMSAAKRKLAISHSDIIAQKRSDVVSLSEGTLTMLDTERVRGINLAGRTIERVRSLLLKWANGLKEGNKHTPMNVLLAGAPSSAKTDLALLTALISQTPAYALVCPKSSLVGQTEQRVRLQFRIFKELSPAFGFIDEITEAFQTQRNSQNLDSGASDAVTAEMLNALSDSSRAGRTLLLATTNCPWRVGAAMASRFIFVPVLSPVEEDYPEILCSVASALLPEADLDKDCSILQAAAREFFSKGASPRVMRTMISSKIASGVGAGSSCYDLITKAARDCAPQHPRDRASAEYADLFAISVCSDLAMLPWHERINEYPLPPYLKGIISEIDGSIDLDRLAHRIGELKPHVNV